MGLFSLSLIECAEQVAMSLGSHECERVILGGTLTNLGALGRQRSVASPGVHGEAKRVGWQSADSLGGKYQHD